MNETPTEPPIDLSDIDDPELLAEIEAEFAELTAEIERISAMPSSVHPQKSELLQALRDNWRNKFKSDPSRPEWRQRLDASLSRAVDRILEDGLQQNADGSLAFNLKGETLQEEGAPVLRGLLDGLVHILEKKFPAPGSTAAAPGPDAPPPNPLQALIGSFGQVLAGALKNAMQGGSTKASIPTDDPSLSDGTIEVQVTPSDTGGEPSGSTKSSFSTEVEKDIAASFEIDNRADAEGNKAEPSAFAKSATEASGVFFQQLIDGLGKAVRQAFTPQPSAPSPAPSTKEESAQAPAPDGPKTQPEAGATAKPENPLAGIGQMLTQVLQNIGTKGPLVLTGVDSKPEEAAEPKPDEAVGSKADEAVETKPDDDAPAKSDETAAEPKPEEAGAEPKPTLKVDLVGLLNQLAGNKTPPSGD